MSIYKLILDNTNIYKKHLQFVIFAIFGSSLSLCHDTNAINHVATNKMSYPWDLYTLFNISLN